MKETVQFYPSHLSKGLAAAFISIVFAKVAVREFSQIGTDTYPIPPTPQSKIPQLNP